ncbi:MAG: sigma 54-interacting transcriptional regulator [Desulfobacterales bacterium]
MIDQELNAYWKTVVDTIHDGIMIVDTGGTIVSVNTAFESITGYPRDEIIGRSCTILHCNTCEARREKTGCHWCQLFRIGNVRNQSCVMMRKDGRYLHILKNAALLHDAHGEVIGGVETMTDVTELIKKDTQIEAFRRQLRAEDGFHGILGSSAPMQRVYDLITNAAQSDAPVIIFGESGTGKELIARAIHESKSAQQRPYVKVNCAALNESLLESELFGHVKGAFTGAHKDRTGRFEAANGGDIFLDEIGDLPFSTQVKLLRVLAEKVIERVGDQRPISIDVRIISATNRDLKRLVEQGNFREDLFYRINVIPIHVPPLRERVSDIPLLAEHFFRRIQLKSDKKINGIAKDAMHVLMAHNWPGNVRELKSTFEYAFVTCQGLMIQPRDLPPDIIRTPTPPPTAVGAGGTRDDTKKRRLIEALEQAGGNQSQAAEILGVTRVTVWNQMRKYGIAAKQNRFVKESQ